MKQLVFISDESSAAAAASMSPCLSLSNQQQRSSSSFHHNWTPPPLPSPPSHPPVLPCSHFGSHSWISHSSGAVSAVTQRCFWSLSLQRHHFSLCYKSSVFARGKVDPVGGSNATYRNQICRNVRLRVLAVLAVLAWLWQFILLDAMCWMLTWWWWSMDG